MRSIKVLPILITIQISVILTHEISFSKTLITLLSAMKNDTLNEHPNECLNELKKIPKNDNLSNIFYSMSGNKLNDLGEFKKCEELIYMKYFIMEVFYPDFWIFNQTYSIGICLPGICGESDLFELRNIFYEGILPTSRNVTLPYIKEEQISFRDVRTSNDYQLKYVSQGALIFILITLSMAIISVLTSMRSLPINSFLVCFSLKENLKTYRIDENKKIEEEGLNFLHGLRVFFMIIVVIGHAILFLVTLGPTLNITETIDYWRDPGQGNVGILAVDAFFCLSGFLAVFQFTRLFIVTQDIHNKILQTILMGYLKRYIRLLGLMAVSLVLYIYINPLLHDGPMSRRLCWMEGPCKDNWIYNMLFIDNMVSWYQVPYICLQFT